jgi:ATP-dependent Clp protease ATP-binding subunit ClpC
MFERFDEPAVKSIMWAQEEARRIGHNFVGTEMILLGLIREHSSVASKSLQAMNVNLADTRVETEKIIGRGSGFVDVEIPFTPRAKLLLRQALELSEASNMRVVCPGHVLLGLIKEAESTDEKKGVAHRVLVNLGIDLGVLRKEVLDHLEPRMVPRTNNKT